MKSIISKRNCLISKIDLYNFSTLTGIHKASRQRARSLLVELDALVGSARSPTLWLAAHCHLICARQACTVGPTCARIHNVMQLIWNTNYVVAFPEFLVVCTLLVIQVCLGMQKFGTMRTFSGLLFSLLFTNIY